MLARSPFGVCLDKSASRQRTGWARIEAAGGASRGERRSRLPSAQQINLPLLACR
jgi:hypothetical protein